MKCVSDITKKQKIDKDTIRIAQRLSRKKRVKAGIKTKAMFSLMRMMQKADFGAGVLYLTKKPC